MGYYCGIDLGDKTTVICLIRKNRQVVAEMEIATNSPSIRKALKAFRGLTCIVEASPLAEWFCKQVEKLGHKISIVCPRKAKAALSGHSLKKTDQRDARALAELCQTGWYEPVHRKSDEAREMRSFMTARKQLVECSNALASSIRGILKAHGIKLESSSGDAVFMDKIEAAISKLPPFAQKAVSELLKAYKQMHEQQKRLYKELNKVAKKDEVTQRLMTIPGVGPATAALFVATIDDPNRFEDGEKVASYLGLTPSVFQSGDTEYRGRITKTGDRMLRWLLVEAAHILLTRSSSSCGLKRWGLKIQEAKGVGKARVAVARRLACIMWKLWKVNQTFNPEAIAA
jgi:transposase